MLLKNLSNASEKQIAHGDAIKFVFENLGFSSNSYTQSAVGKMNKQSVCNFHKHESMIEIFYFISGKGKYTINNKDYIVSEGSYLRIDPNEIHGLKCISEELIFFYIGIPLKI